MRLKATIKKEKIKEMLNDVNRMKLYDENIVFDELDDISVIASCSGISANIIHNVDATLMHELYKLFEKSCYFEKTWVKPMIGMLFLSREYVSIE